jgi:transcriptional regulator with XRE-family HTH domain
VIASRSAVLKTVGTLIRERRQAEGLSQEELGALAGLDRTYISGLERGIRNPSLTALVSLSTSLKITTSDLLQGLESKAEEKCHQKF